MNNDELEYMELDNEESETKEVDSKGKKKKPKKKRTILQEIVINSIYLLVVFLLALCMVKFVGQRTVVNGSSMNPTLEDGDNLIVDKLTYTFSDPKRFDIIVFPYKYKKGEYYIKRIIGLPGETVRIDYDGTIYINGNVLEEHYGKEVIENPGDAVNGITLGKDEYFVLGDNRNNSSDSRIQYDVGNIKRKDIIGKALLRIYPFDKFGIVKHK